MSEGLLPDDLVDVNEIDSPLLRCAVPDRVVAGADCKWPMLRVSTSHRLAGLNPLDAETEHRAWLDAIDIWNQNSGIELYYTDEFDRANIYAAPGSMGSGTLAWSYLPCGASASSRMEQQYNRSVRWSYGLLLDTITHEVGHALGLNHSGSNQDIMRPFSNGQLGRLGPGDIEEIQRRYGKPQPKPPEPPTPPPEPPENPTEIQVEGTILLNGKPFILIPKVDYDILKTRA